MGPHTHTYIYYTQFGYNFTLKKKEKMMKGLKKKIMKARCLALKTCVMTFCN